MLSSGNLLKIKRTIGQMWNRGHNAAAFTRPFNIIACAFLCAAPAFAAKSKTPTPVIYVGGVTAYSVSLYWTDVSGSEIDWSLERATNSTGPFVEVVRLSPNTTNYTDTTVSPATTYYYRAGYLPSKGTRKTSNVVKVKTLAAGDTTPPTVNVTAPAPNALVAGTVTLSASATDNVAVVRVDFFVDGALVGSATAAPFSISFDTRTVASGGHSATAKASDAAGNQGTSSAVAFTCDNTPPSVPASVNASAVSSSQINVSWNASTDAIAGVAYYRVYRNGTLAATLAPTSYSDTNLAAGVPYCYAVVAVDRRGNVSAASADACATTLPPPDTTTPSVPTGVAATAVSCSQVNVSWNASTDAGSGVQSYLVYRDGVLWRTVAAGTTSTTDTSVSASTSYSYAVAAKDVVGNQSANSAAASVSVPACPDTTPPTAPTNVVATAANCSQVNVSWSPAADGGSGVQSYLVFRDGVFFREVAAPDTSTTDTTVSPASTWFYSVAAKDAAGNQSSNSPPATANVPACPDTAPPSVPADVAATAVNCGQVNVSWSASTDAGSGVQSYLVFRNGVFWREVAAPATSTADTSVSASTSYTYAVAAKDVAGNQSANSTAASTSVPACPDTTPPAVPGNVTATAVTCTRLDVSWSASTDGASGVKGYRVHRNGVFVQEVLAPTLSWSDTSAAGSTTYSYSVSAFDNAGNVSALSTAASATTPSCGGTPTGRFVSVTLLGGTDSDYGMTVAVDANGNIGSGGNVAGKAYFAKLSPSRQVLWSMWLGAASSVQSIAFDANGDVVMAGYFYATVDFGGGPMTSAGGYDIFVAKFSSTGVLLWAKRYGCPQGADFAGDEAGHGIAVDSNGNIAVAGSFIETVDFGTGPVTSRGGKDGFILKLTPNGAPLWLRTFGNAGTDDSATCVRFDAANNLIVGGRFSVDVDFGGGVLTAAGSYDACVAKYSASGAHLWSKRAGGTGYDTIRALSVDAAGDVLVTGDYRNAATFDGVSFTGNGEEDVFLAKYSGVNGAQHWAKSFGSWNTDNGNAVGTDSERNVVIAGRLGAAMNFGGENVSTPRSGYNVYVAKFTPSGAHLWSKALGNGREDARGVTFDARQYPFVVGRCALTNNFGGGVFTNYGNNLNPDLFVLELEP